LLLRRSGRESRRGHRLEKASSHSKKGPAKGRKRKTPGYRHSSVGKLPTGKSHKKRKKRNDPERSAIRCREENGALQKRVSLERRAAQRRHSKKRSRSEKKTRRGSCRGYRHKKQSVSSGRLNSPGNLFPERGERRENRVFKALRGREGGSQLLGEKPRNKFLQRSSSYRLSEKLQA